MKNDKAKQEILNDALLKAVKCNDTSAALEAIHMGADVRMCRGYNGSPLHLAAHNNSVELVSALVSMGADVNAVIKMGGEASTFDKKAYENWTPLHETADEGSVSAARALIKAGADARIKMSGGLTAAEIARLNKHYDLAAELERAAQAEAPTIDVGALEAKLFKELNRFFSSNEDALKILMVPGVRGDTVRGSCGQTAFHLAIKKGYVSLVKSMIKAGVDVNVADGERNTPLHYAAYHGRKEIVALLLEAGADRTAVNRSMHSAAMLARGKQSYEIQHLLSAHPVTAPPKDIQPDIPENEVIDTQVHEVVWKKQGAASIAQVETLPDLSCRITTLFNFQSRQCTVMLRNLETGQEAVSGSDMDAMSPAAVKAAAEAFVAAGGDRDVVAFQPHRQLARKTVLPKGGIT
ncbi:MAG: ankyrin repeat domain-containing protein [Alphaproteobacteria bacterium]|nr:ankyrin repeat domain-containing protein [Alphaproteobacteria bacterium]